MPHTEKFDVIVVGAGPGGSLTGYLLSKHGFKTMIIEKKRIPRHKVCAGGLTKKALDILPFDITGIIEDYSYTAKFFVENKPVFTRTVDYPIVAMVMRDAFDHFMVKKAITAGTVVLDGITFRSLSGSTGNLNVETSEGTYRTRLVVGADGVNSKIAEALGLQASRNVMTAIEGEVYYGDSDTVKNLSQSFHIDFGAIPRGYGWIFPKSDHLSIGLVTTLNKIKGLKNYFKSYITSKDLCANAEIRSLKGHFLPYRPDRRKVFSNNIGLLVGDAAGLADPVTGEGIYYAIREAQIASDVILQSFSLGYEHLEQYNNILKTELINDLIFAQRMANMLYKCPALGYWILKTYGKEILKYQVDITAGKTTYSEVQHKVPGLSTIMSILFS
ncbi:MAG: hypothetical protein BA872_06065 [Desulfobacterales bacterium C00003060]|nr:MAG: hypothetical protein BA861_06570 [Desulfobacterales bacterium S3730MH5]OEU81280.1 MAG: hypothetical protein BA872_06065 [Desulfobacterales bacterium C00003060]